MADPFLVKLILDDIATQMRDTTFTVGERVKVDGPVLGCEIASFATGTIGCFDIVVGFWRVNSLLDHGALYLAGTYIELVAEDGLVFGSTLRCEQLFRGNNYELGAVFRNVSAVKIRDVKVYAMSVLHHMT